MDERDRANKLRPSSPISFADGANDDTKEPLSFVEEVVAAQQKISRNASKGCIRSTSPPLELIE